MYEIKNLHRHWVTETRAITSVWWWVRPKSLLCNFCRSWGCLHISSVIERKKTTKKKANVTNKRIDRIKEWRNRFLRESRRTGSRARRSQGGGWMWRMGRADESWGLTHVAWYISLGRAYLQPCTGDLCLLPSLQGREACHRMLPAHGPWRDYVDWHCKTSAQESLAKISCEKYCRC